MQRAMQHVYSIVEGDEKLIRLFFLSCLEAFSHVHVLRQCFGYSGKSYFKVIMPRGFRVM